MAAWCGAIHHWLCVWFLWGNHREWKYVKQPTEKQTYHFSEQRASSSTSHWENQLQLMKKSAEFFHLQWTHLEKTSLPPAAALLVLWNPIWRIWGNSIPVPPYVLSQLQRELLWRRKPPMSTLFPVLCSAEFSSLRKQPRILPKSTFLCVLRVLPSPS